MYGKGRQKHLEGSIAWLTDNIKLLLVDNADYTVSIDVDEFHSNVTGAGIVATSGNFAGKTSTLGVADANDITLTAVTGDPSESIVIYKDTGVSGTSPLLVYLDTATGLPITPNGGDINIIWDSGANRIFKLDGEIPAPRIEQVPRGYKRDGNIWIPGHTRNLEREERRAVYDLFVAGMD